MSTPEVESTELPVVVVIGCPHCAVRIEWDCLLSEGHAGARAAFVSARREFLQHCIEKHGYRWVQVQP